MQEMEKRDDFPARDFSSLLKMRMGRCLTVLHLKATTLSGLSQNLVVSRINFDGGCQVDFGKSFWATPF